MTNREDFRDYVSLRPFRETDRSFIEKHWLKGAYFGDANAREIPEHIFDLEHIQLIKKCMSDPGAWCTLACLTDDPDIIVGFSIGRKIPGHPNTLHFVFVKSQWRNKLIASALVPADLGQVTQLTRIGRSIMQKKFPNAIFNPYFIREK